MISKKTNQNLELTQSQSLMWIGQKLNPDSPLYNVAYSFDISGEINIENFKKAFQELVAELDVFRTVFIEQENIPYQSVLPHYDYDLEVIHFSEQSTEIEIQNWLDLRTTKLLDLTRPLFDSAMLKINERRYIWYLNFHHVITDAASSTIIHDAMSEIYGQINQEKQFTSGAYPSFSSYVKYEKEERENSSESIKTYWNDKIKNSNPAPIFYGKKNAKHTTEAKRISFKLGLEVSKKLKEIAQKPEIRAFTEHLSLFNIFSSLLFIYIYRVSGQKNITVGAPSHNRSTKVFKKTPGLFVEILPLVAELSEDDSFSSVLKRTRLESNMHLKHASSGMATAEISRSFGVIFNYINADFSSFDGFPMESRWIHPNHCDPAHQLRCHVYDMHGSGDIEINFDLNSAIFHNDLFKKVPEHFLKLVDAFIEDIDQPILKPSLLSLNESIALKEKPATSNTEFISILSQFNQQVVLNGKATAIHHKSDKLTYADLDIKSNQLANYLKRKGVTEENKIAVYLERSPEYIISVLAIMKLGSTFVPIASDQSEKRLSYILDDSKCSKLLTTSNLNENIDATSIEIINLNREKENIKEESTKVKNSINSEGIAYSIYTSGTAGNPKGVLVSHGSLANYLSWAKSFYKTDEPFVFPLFTSIGFDLTITSTFLPLITGGELIIYKESGHGPDISLMEVLEENKVNSIKLTPSHLALIQNNDNSNSQIRTMIVGGEDFKTKIATNIQERFGKDLRIFNEYGPTESTVGCIVSKFYKHKHKDTSVPIGLPIEGMQAYIFDEHMNLVPEGVIGSLYVGGAGLSQGYLNLEELTSEKFIQNPFNKDDKLYHTGDMARINFNGEYEYLGRIDEQVKLRGFRIELTDIEANLLKHESVENTAVVIIENEKAIPESEVINCSDCGLPSNYPNTDFDENGVCHVCNAFKGYKEQAQKYFKTEDELRNILMSKRGQSPNYDCISLLSGGKDSTYILAQLVSMGLKVLAFTLDNGYISDQAKDNIGRIVSRLDVDHIYGTTEHMNKIFVDSLHRHHNVCNGCFKTIYTLATKIALDKQIPFVVTGLSRGQFFETRLTEELFWDENADVAKVDDTILEARKLYHQEEDAVKDLMDVSAFNNDETFDKVQFIDFYRYSDVSLEEMLVFLREKVDWVRPTDTGRSTNCTINQLGIYVHKKEKGYSNYSFPYSWDVRMGHKTRTETLEEINEIIDEVEVKRIMQEIGYTESSESELEQKRLVGYYTGKQKLSSIDLANHLKKELPAYMVPTHFKYIDELPLTANGKVDKSALKALNNSQLEMETPFVAPEGEIEELLASIWKEVLRLKQVGVHDDFIGLGGHSLAAIRVTARINEEVEMKFPLNKIFELPTISEYSKYLEQTLIALLED